MKKKILLIITLIIISVIFLHSSMPAAESTIESDNAYNMLDGFTAFLHLPNLFNTITIRKLAHFAEFAVYGLFLAATVRAYCEQLKGEVFKILFFLLCVPVIDEAIQYFPDGRSAQVSDVILDFSGGIFGFICLALFAYIINRLYKNMNKSKK